MINLKRVDHDPGLFATPRLEWGCLYLHMETHPLRNNFTAGTRGSFSPAGISDHSGNIQFVDGGKGGREDEGAAIPQIVFAVRK